MPERLRKEKLQRSGEMRRVSDLIIAKNERNKRENLLAFTENAPSPYVGVYREKCHRIRNLLVIYDQESCDRIYRRIITPLRELAKKHRISVIFANEADLPSHTTIDGWEISGDLSEIDQMIVSTQLSKKGHFTLWAKALKSLEFQFDTLVLGVNSYLSVSKVNLNQAGILRIRTLLAKRFNYSNQVSFKPLYPDQVAIYHTSLMRIVGYENPKDVTAFFEEAYALLSEKLNRRPIKVKPVRVLIGSSEDFYNTYRPHLLRDNL